MNPTANDHDVLAALNADYIASVQRGDVKRFDEILSPDFLNSNPDGTIVDRAGFLAQIARPAAPPLSPPPTTCSDRGEGRAA